MLLLYFIAPFKDLTDEKLNKWLGTGEYDKEYLYLIRKIATDEECYSKLLQAIKDVRAKNAFIDNNEVILLVYDYCIVLMFTHMMCFRNKF